MKKLFLFAVLAMAITFFASCSTDQYDDTGLRNELNDLENRVSQLEELCATFNSDISNLKIIVTALQSNDYITSYSALANGSGCQITFAKGGTIIINHGIDGTSGANGADGTNGVNAPVIGVDIDNGVYYWTITTNGNTTWLLDNSNSKLRVTGEKGDRGDNGSDGTNGSDGNDGNDGKDGKDGQNGTDGNDGKDGENGTNGTDGKDGKDGEDGANGVDGITPILGVDAVGYWTIDIGDGNGAKRLKDTNGQDIKAIGVDGQNGTNGENGKDGENGADGEDGTSVFKGVSEDSNNVYFTLADDSVITIPKGVGFSFVVEDATSIQRFEYGEIKSYIITKNNITNIAISTPNGWKAVINENTLKITAADVNNIYSDEEGIVSLIATSPDNRSVIVNINVISDYIDFVDPNIRALTPKWDIDGDGRVSKAEAAQITAIVIKDETISSFDEIKYFTSLTALEFYNGQLLASLDLTKNTALQSLIFLNTQLITFDVSNCTELIGLMCGDNQLATLDLSNNTKLEYLSCGHNQLTTLDLSNNTKLEYLSCENNQLTTLDVSNNTELTDLSCAYNQLTTLDLSNNIKLGELYCLNNQLTTLDLSNCSELTVLFCYYNQLVTLDLSNSTELIDLRCRNNQLTTLDLSNCSELVQFDGQANQLTTLDVSNSTELLHLFCMGNQLATLDVSNNTALTILNCYGNQLTILDLSNNTELEHLLCCYNQLTTLDASNNTELQTLDCRWNPNLTELWLKYGQTITTLDKDTDTVIKYK